MGFNEILVYLNKFFLMLKRVQLDFSGIELDVHLF